MLTMTEMLHYGPPMAEVQPTTPPSSPSLPSSEHILSWNNAQQFIDMVKAVVDMHIASPPVSKCTCSHTAGETPTLQGSAQPLTSEHLEQLVLKLLEGKVPGSTRKSEDTQALAPEANQPEDVAAQASKLEFETVDEVYVSRCFTSSSQLTSCFRPAGTRRLTSIQS